MRLNAVFLLAGTAIGSGMIALPIVLAKFGVIKTCLIMILFSMITYFSALIRADLNLNSNPCATLRDASKIFNENIFGNVGYISLLLLSFALMSAYIFGLSSILYAFCDRVVSQKVITIFVSAIIALVLSRTSNGIVSVNKALFITMILSLFCVIVLLVIKTPLRIMPVSVHNISIHDWTMLVPIVFTSFGFQGSVHSVTKLCDNDRSSIKCACFWGSVIPAIVYIIWTMSVLTVIANTNHDFFDLMIRGQQIEVGELVKVLSLVSHVSIIKNIIWIISILAILTSIVGVGLALKDVLQQEFSAMKLGVSTIIVVVIPAIVGALTPNAFVRILNVSGILLSIFAIIAPICIYRKMICMKKADVFFKSISVIYAIFLFGVVIITFGIADLIYC